MAPCCAPARRRVRIRAPRRAVPLVLLAAVALGAAPPQAPQSDGHGVDGVTVSPHAVAGGGRVGLQVDACEEDTGVAYSDAFDQDAELKASADGGLYGEARIRRSAEPGRYRVTVDCDGEQGIARGWFRVVAHASPSPTPTPASPSAPVRAGGGGTADRHDGEAGGGFGAGGGLVLVLAAMAGFATYLLRTRRSNGHG